MKICICTTPIRPVPTKFPPFGSMAIIQSLYKLDEDAHFYNIDYFRPRREEIGTYFAEHEFDIVGVSAVVSTAYAYTKDLTKLIRSVSPNTKIVVGGNLAASAEILLRKCEVDFCVVGDGEIVIQNLVKALYENPLDDERLKQIRGICYLNKGGHFHFTGYGTPPDADEIEWPDYDILKADGSLPYFISDEQTNGAGGRFYNRLTPEEIQGKKVATVITAKGCVARCTFCHRWEKGYRVPSSDRTIQHIQFLKDRYGVGLISIGDENFGSNRELTRDLVTRLGKMDIRWRGAGVRARTVNADMLRYWKKNGCAMVFYGIESGSQKMLDVMEKNTTVQMNIDGLRWTHEAGLFSIVQLVLGMPGENDQTIRETIEFMKTVTPYLYLDGKLPSNLMSTNYAQSLPGTPLYEYAREHGYIGNTLDDEEAYLMAISDTDAYSTDHFINYTSQPMLKVLIWRYWLTGEVDAHYFQHTLGITLSLPQVLWFIAGWVLERRARKLWVVDQVARLLPNRRLSVNLVAELLRRNNNSDFTRSGYFNIKTSWSVPLFLNPVTRRFFYLLLAVIVAEKHANSLIQSFKLIFDHLRWSLFRRSASRMNLSAKSLRRVVKVEPATTDPHKEDLMIPLRMGR